jgi:hypothetical protein
MARKAFTDHPKFMDAGSFANVALLEAAACMGLGSDDMFGFEEHANRVVDDLTRLLLRAYDAKQAKK